MRKLRSSETLRLCALCGVATHQSTPHHVQAVHNKSNGAKVSLYWHANCVDNDEPYQEFVDADWLLPDGNHSEAARSTWDTLLDAVLKRHGKDGLRGAVHVRADIKDNLSTLRGAGELWGRPSSRALNKRNR